VTPREDAAAVARHYRQRAQALDRLATDPAVSPVGQAAIREAQAQYRHEAALWEAMRDAEVGSGGPAKHPPMYDDPAAGAPFCEEDE
jgi:hypothetical protein